MIFCICFHGHSTVNSKYLNVVPNSPSSLYNASPLESGSCLDTDSCQPLQQLLLDSFSSNSELNFDIKSGRWVYENFIDDKKIMIPNIEMKKWAREKGSKAPQLLQTTNILDIVPPNSILINGGAVVFSEMVGYHLKLIIIVVVTQNA